MLRWAESHEEPCGGLKCSNSTLARGPEDVQTFRVPFLKDKTHEQHLMTTLSMQSCNEDQDGTLGVDVSTMHLPIFWLTEHILGEHSESNGQAQDVWIFIEFHLCMNG